MSVPSEVSVFPEVSILPEASVVGEGSGVGAVSSEEVLTRVKIPPAFPESAVCNGLIAAGSGHLALSDWRICGVHHQVASVAGGLLARVEPVGLAALAALGGLGWGRVGGESAWMGLGVGGGLLLGAGGSLVVRVVAPFPAA
ncbi:hypothetical protein GCM10028793_57380 [Nocardiopsis oceani]